MPDVWWAVNSNGAGDRGADEQRSGLRIIWDYDKAEADGRAEKDRAVCFCTGGVFFMYSLIAAVPILLCVILMVAFGWPARRAMPLAYLAAVLEAGLLWKMQPGRIAAGTVLGFLSALEILLIIFGAILLMNVLKLSGAMASINRLFSHITRDARLQCVLVGCVFAGFIEGSAGFGTPAALAAPILISLGFPPLAAATVCLIYNSWPVEPGPVGVPLLTASSTVRDAVLALGGDPDRFTKQLTRWVCLPQMIGGCLIIMVGVAVLVKVFGKNHSFRDLLPAIPFCLLSGAVVGTIYLVMAFFAGPELTSMTAFIGALPVLILAARKGFLVPKEVWTFDGVEDWGDPAWKSSGVTNATVDKGMHPFKAWLPYLIIGLLLVLTRVDFFGIKQLLSSDPLILHVTNIFGNADMNWNFKVLYNPGILPFVLVSLLTMVMHGMSGGEAVQAVKATFRQISGAALALLFGIAMVNLYRYSGSAGMESMLYMMADAMAGLFRGAYFIAAPLIGVLGAFMSGSNTVSNTLFASIQFETATILGISQVLIVALQAMGGAIGNMICIHNIVAVCATTGTNGNEGRLIRTNIVPCLIYAFTVAAIVGIFLAAGVNPMPELLAG
jgi:lactate permease